MGGMICSDSKSRHTIIRNNVGRDETKENLKSKSKEENKQSALNNRINKKINNNTDRKTSENFNQSYQEEISQNDEKLSKSPKNSVNKIEENNNKINNQFEDQKNKKQNNEVSLFENIQNQNKFNFCKIKNDINIIKVEEITKSIDSLKEKKNKNINLNIIYLVDLTGSMNKHKKLVQNINSINQSLKINMKI